MQINKIELKENSFKFEAQTKYTKTMCKPKEYIESADILAHDFKWKLRFFPKQDNDTAGVFLQLTNPLKDVECKIKFWIVRANGEQANKLETSHIFTKTVLDWGYRDFIRRKVLCDPQYNLIDKKVLTLGCEVDIINGITPPAPRTLARDFGCLFLSKNFSDLNILVDKREIPAHKMILSVRSSVFAAMFEHRMKENVFNILKIDDLAYDVVLEMLRFIYTDLCNVKDLTTDLLAAADKYNLELLKQKCEQRLREDLTIPTAVETLIAAELHNCCELKKSAAKFVKTNFKEIVKRDEWKQLVKNNPALLNNVLIVVMDT